MHDFGRMIKDGYVAQSDPPCRYLYRVILSSEANIDRIYASFP